jgi:hypothetical protein
VNAAGDMANFMTSSLIAIFGMCSFFTRHLPSWC